MPIVRVAFLALLVTVFGAIRSSLPGASLPPSSFTEERIWEETLDQARDAGIDYIQLSQAARRGSLTALDRLIWLGTKTDAAGSIGHGIVLVYLLQDLGDQRLAAALRRRPDGEKRVLRELLRAGLAYGPWGVRPESLPSCFPMSDLATR